MQLLVRLPGVDAPAALVGKSKELHGAAKDGTGRRDTLVALATPEHDQGAEAEQDGRKGVREPETDVKLAVNHAELAGKSTDVDEEIEVVINPRSRKVRVNNDTLASGEGLDNHPGQVKLFNNQRVDVGLETTGTETHEDDTEREAGESSVRVLDNRRKTRHDEDDVTEDIDAERIADSLETSEVAVGDVGTEKGHGILPERVEGGQTGGGTLAHAQGTGNGLLDIPVDNVTGRRSGRKRLLNEVGEDSSRTIVRETLAKLDESDGVDVERNLVRDTAECPQILLGRDRLVDIGRDVVVGDGKLSILLLCGGVDGLSADGDVLNVVRHGDLLSLGWPREIVCQCRNKRTAGRWGT